MPEKPSTEREARRIPTVSAVLPDGALLEMVYDPERSETAFVVARNGAWTREPFETLEPGHRLVPYGPHNNLLRNGVVLLPAEPEEYGSERELVGAIQAFLHRYVRPYPRDQFGLPDNLTGVFEKRNQDVVSPATKWNDLVRLLERALGDIELEWAKPKPDCTR